MVQPISEEQDRLSRVGFTHLSYRQKGIIVGTGFLNLYIIPTDKSNRLQILAAEKSSRLIFFTIAA